MHKGTIPGHSGHKCKDLSAGCEVKGNQQKKCKITQDGKSPWKYWMWSFSTGNSVHSPREPSLPSALSLVGAEQIFPFLCPAVARRGSTGSLWGRLLPWWSPSPCESAEPICGMETSPPEQMKGCQDSSKSPTFNQTAKIMKLICTPESMISE